MITIKETTGLGCEFPGCRKDTVAGISPWIYGQKKGVARCFCKKHNTKINRQKALKTYQEGK